jgi:exopolysaccharide biosynthesis polyprenyl glycosylphosphotransferase
VEGKRARLDGLSLMEAATGVADAAGVQPDAACPSEPVDRLAGGAIRDARGFYMRRVLAVADATAVLLAFALAIVLDGLTRFDTAADHLLVLLPLLPVTWVVLAGTAGMYHVDDRRIDCSIADEVFRVVQLVALWIWLVFGLVTLVDTGSPPAGPALALGTLTVPLVLIGRATARLVARRRPWYRQRAVIVGTEQDTWRVTRTLRRHPEYGIEIAATIHLRDSLNDDSDGVTASGVDAVLATVVREQAHRVMFASHYEGIDERTGALRFLAERSVKVDLVPGDSDVFRSDAELHHIEGLPLLTLPTTIRSRAAQAIKRAIDVTVSSLALVLASPFLAVAAAAIKLDSRGSVFFRQERVGRSGERFALLKFRTMVEDAEEHKPQYEALNVHDTGMFKIPHDPRITGVGRFLRRHSLDEVPQLVNVLRGDMSLVGPRPLIEEESALVSERYSARFDVRPGITGPWQVFGRSDIPFEDMVKLDYTYVTNWTVGDDFKLMVRTLNAVGSGKGAY